MWLFTVWLDWGGERHGNEKRKRIHLSHTNTYGQQGITPRETRKVMKYQFHASGIRLMPSAVGFAALTFPHFQILVCFVGKNA